MSLCHRLAISYQISYPGGMTETEIQKEILTYLQRTGWMAWKNHVGSVKVRGGRTTNQKKGSPDIEAIKNGLFLGVEVKTGTGHIQQVQVDWLENIVKHGGMALVVHSLETAIIGLGDWGGGVWYSKDFNIRG